jgi:hypothetical protein
MRLRRRDRADHQSGEQPDHLEGDEVQAAVSSPPQEGPATDVGPSEGRRVRRQPLRARVTHERSAAHTDDEDRVPEEHTAETHTGHPHAEAAEPPGGHAQPGHDEADDTGQHPAHDEQGDSQPSSRSGRAAGTKSWVRGLFDEQVAASREEAEQQAALELRQSMTPAMDQLVLNVPGSSSPEEAGAILDRQSAIELEKPVEVSPSSVVDLNNPPEMRAYPPAENLSNRVLRLANRHWAKGKPRTSAEVVAEKTAIAEQDFARKPVGTQRCFAFRDGQRCRGVFVFNAEERGQVMRCPTCMTPHLWDEDIKEWMPIDDAPEVARAPTRGAVSAGS